jgi:hypothetical protein
MAFLKLSILSFAAAPDALSGTSGGSRERRLRKRM